MKILLQADNTLHLPLEMICEDLNSICKGIRFTSEATSIHFSQENISCPKSFIGLPKPLSRSDCRVVFTTLPYDNNFFYEEHESTIIVSSYNWNRLTDQPLINGIYYFIATILAEDLGFGNPHYSSKGCINDFLVDKTGIDAAMRAASLCPDCRRDLKSKKLNASHLITLLDHISCAARVGKSVIDLNVDSAAGNRIDLFICHNSEDKIDVRRINAFLKEHGIQTWLDEENLMPGDDWQEVIQGLMPRVKAAAVCVGPSGFGPWQRMEIKGLLSEFAERGTRIVPVILPAAEKIPELPIFLRQLTWLDLRNNKDAKLRRLIDIL